MKQIDQSSIKLHNNKVIDKFLRIDYDFLLKIYSINTKLTPLIRFYSFFGSILFWGPFILSVYSIGSLMNFSDVKDFGLILFSCLILSSIIVGFSKKAAKRKRPYHNDRCKAYLDVEIVNRDRWFGFKELNSFPSGHIAQISSSMILFSYFLSPLWFFPFLIIAILMIFARGHLGVHFLSDTIIGGIFGVFIGYLTIWLWPIFFDPFFHWIWVTFFFYL